MSNLGNLNISPYVKMPRSKPTIQNVIEGFLLQDPNWDLSSEDDKYKQVEILWIDNKGKIKSRKIKYLGKFHKKLMRANKVSTDNTPFIRTSGGYLKKRIQPVSVNVEANNEMLVKNELQQFQAGNQQSYKVSTNLLGVMKTLQLII